MPHGHWKTLTLVAALRINGLTAPYVIDGAMDGPSFLAYVEQILAPTLRKGDIVFMDNLRTHKIDGVRQALEAVGAKLRYLPAYSPDLKPSSISSFNHDLSDARTAEDKSAKTSGVNKSAKVVLSRGDLKYIVPDGHRFELGVP